MSHAITCKNCGASLIDTHCHKCGQKASTSRLTLKSLWHEVIHSLTHIEKGFFYTSIELFIHPGKVVNDYLSGKRVNYYKPLGLYTIWIAIFLLVDNILKGKTQYVNVIDFLPNSSLYDVFLKVYPYYEHYIALILLPAILLAPLVTYPLIFKRLNYNYAEVIVLSIYLGVTGYITAIVITLLGVITNTYTLLEHNRVILITSSLFQSWALFDIVKRDPYWKSMLWCFCFISLGYVGFVLYLRFAIPFIVSLFI